MILSLYSLSLVLSLVTTEKSLAPSSSHPRQVFIQMEGIPFQPYAQKPERLQNQRYKIL